MVYDYTATRERAGPEEFLQNHRGYLQADAYVAYDSFFVKPERGMVEVGCWAHARRHVHQALDNDLSRMRLAVSEQTLKKRLHEKGLLASVDVSRETLTVRRSICGTSKSVLHFRRSTVLPEVSDGDEDAA